MADPSFRAMKSPSRSSSALLLPVPDSAEVSASSVRPRNRRPASFINPDDGPDDRPASTRTSSPSSSGFFFESGSAGRSPNRSPSPLPASHISRTGGRKPSPSSNRVGGTSTAGSAALGKSKGLLDAGGWTSSWASVQEFATSFLGGGDGTGPNKNGLGGSPGRPRQTLARDFTGSTSAPRREADTWGPEPPRKKKSAPGAKDIAAGTLSERETALKAAKMASVLESHEGVNGGLDVAGRFKLRTSDDLPRGGEGSQTGVDPEEEHLVYIHHVQPGDTYAGIVLKYRCREDAFRKANGLWSRDGIQVRKWLSLPVDACEVKGRPCDPPSWYNTQGVDLLAPTPEASDLQKLQQEESPFGQPRPQADDFFSRPANGARATQTQLKAQEDDRPWVNVRWVAIESFAQPVEIARVPRKALGYFPPRRKKSLHTLSTVSTPRQSLDIGSTDGTGASTTTSTGAGVAAAGTGAADRTAGTRRLSTLSNTNRPRLASTPTTASSSRSRVGSGSGDAADPRPTWMRRPGGVGSMGKNVRAPGPEKDYLNSWAKKHLPGLNIESLPSMSVMGSESASFGFANLGFGVSSRETQASAAAVAGPAGTSGVGIVESPFEDGRDVESTSRQGSGLDRAAAAVETWLRGALANVKRPSTPILGPRRPVLGDEGDLIELADTSSDDGRMGGLASGGGGLFGAGGSGSASLLGAGSASGAGIGVGPGSTSGSSGLLGSMMSQAATSARGEGEGSAGMRGRTPGNAGPGTKGKAD